MSIDYTIKAIPTIYNGRRYRSRLEAKWAAFFDICGWTHEYEPADLGAWSPDFIIRTARDPILVEVKPITRLDDETCYRMAETSRSASFGGSLLLLGTSPFDCHQENPAVSIGWIGSIRHPFPFHDFEIADWSNAQVRKVDNRFDIGAGDLVEIADEWYQPAKVTPPAALVHSIWATASNVVQWRGRDS